MSIICCSSGSSTPARSLWRSSMRSSTSLCEPSSSSVGVMPSMRMTSCASQSRNVMNQLKTTKKTRIGTATASATASARGSVYDFGTISPITTCRIVIRTNATTTESGRRDAAGDASHRALEHSRHGRLAERAQRQRRERDAELHRRDEVRRVGDDLPHRARPAAPLGDELVEPRVPHGDERVLRSDEERVPEHADDDEQELDRGEQTHARAFRARAGRLGGSSSVGATSVTCLPGCGATSRAAPGACSNVIDRRSSKREHSCGGGQPSTRSASRAWSASGSAGSRSSACA